MTVTSIFLASSLLLSPSATNAYTLTKRIRGELPTSSFSAPEKLVSGIADAAGKFRIPEAMQETGTEFLKRVVNTSNASQANENTSLGEYLSNDNVATSMRDLSTSNGASTENLIQRLAATPDSGLVEVVGGKFQEAAMGDIENPLSNIGDSAREFSIKTSNGNLFGNFLDQQQVVIAVAMLFLWFYMFRQCLNQYAAEKAIERDQIPDTDKLVIPIDEIQKESEFYLPRELELDADDEPTEKMKVGGHHVKHLQELVDYVRSEGGRHSNSASDEMIPEKTPGSSPRNRIRGMHKSESGNKIFLDMMSSPRANHKVSTGTGNGGTSSKSIIFLAGDSNFDNHSHIELGIGRQFFFDDRLLMSNAHTKIYDSNGTVLNSSAGKGMKFLTRPDVAWNLNANLEANMAESESKSETLLTSTNLFAINAAVAGSPAAGRVSTFVSKKFAKADSQPIWQHRQDKFIHDNISEKDVLAVAVGGNDFLLWTFNKLSMMLSKKFSKNSSFKWGLKRMFYTNNYGVNAVEEYVTALLRKSLIEKSKKAPKMLLFITPSVLNIEQVPGFMGNMAFNMLTPEGKADTWKKLMSEWEEVVLEPIKKKFAKIPEFEHMKVDVLHYSQDEVLGSGRYSDWGIKPFETSEEHIPGMVSQFHANRALKEDCKHPVTFFLSDGEFDRTTNWIASRNGDKTTKLTLLDFIEFWKNGSEAHQPDETRIKFGKIDVSSSEQRIKALDFHMSIYSPWSEVAQMLSREAGESGEFYIARLTGEKKPMTNSGESSLSLASIGDDHFRFSKVAYLNENIERVGHKYNRREEDDSAIQPEVELLRIGLKAPPMLVHAFELSETGGKRAAGLILDKIQSGIMDVRAMI